MWENYSTLNRWG